MINTTGIGYMLALAGMAVVASSMDQAAREAPKPLDIRVSEAYGQVVEMSGPEISGEVSGEAYGLADGAAAECCEATKVVSSMLEVIPAPSTVIHVEDPDLGSLAPLEDVRLMAPKLSAAGLQAPEVTDLEFTVWGMEDMEDVIPAPVAEISVGDPDLGPLPSLEIRLVVPKLRDPSASSSVD